MKMNHDEIKSFLSHTYRHFNAAVVVEAAEAWREQLAKGNSMFLTLAGAMSTAELGILLAEMIREEKVHAICCTGANLEEDLFNLVAHDFYRRIPDWRALSVDEEKALADAGLNRVTDTCIPEEEAMRRVEKVVRARWRRAAASGQRRLPHAYLYDVLNSGELSEFYQVPVANSWLYEAARRDLPLFVPGWEDSTLGNMAVACNRMGELEGGGLDAILSGLHYMDRLIDWYQAATKEAQVGFFQIGGGIAGDFPICVVPLIGQDLEEPVELWSYFCQISDSTTSYGSYSGAVPNEKITWGKLDTTCPKFIIESDATIVAPLVFSYVLAD